jgi:hypothetical protein
MSREKRMLLSEVRNKSTRLSVQGSLRDVKLLVHPPPDEVATQKLSGRWILFLAIAAIPMSLLFAWGFLHLLLVLVFPKVSALH